MNKGMFIKVRLQLEQKHFPQGVEPAEIHLLDEVEQALERAYQAGYAAAAADRPERWSNQSCMGYAIMAGVRAGLGEDQIARIVRSLHRVFDDKSLEVAAERYRRSPY